MSELEEPKPMDLNGQKRWEGGGREGGRISREGGTAWTKAEMWERVGQVLGTGNILVWLPSVERERGETQDGGQSWRNQLPRLGHIYSGGRGMLTEFSEMRDPLHHDEVIASYFCLPLWLEAVGGPGFCLISASWSPSIMPDPVQESVNDCGEFA